MTNSQRETIKEVIEAMELHCDIISNNYMHGARISKKTLGEIADGMDISIAKLTDLLEEE